MCSESERGRRAGPAGGEDPRLSVAADFLKGVCLATLGQSWCCCCRLAASDLQCHDVNLCAFDTAGRREEGCHPALVLHEGLERRSSDSALLPVT